MAATSKYPLEGQVALVTGGGTGMYRIHDSYCPVWCWCEGIHCRVMAGFLEKAASEASSIPGSGSLVPLKMDVVKEEDIEAAALVVSRNDKMLNIVVNNPLSRQAQGISEPISHLETFIAGKLAAEDAFGLEGMDDWIDIFKLNTITPHSIIHHVGGNGSLLVHQ
ncbi:hypothetical protein CYLTODRAFT_444169 [Cylindrobasidium torrendii FP15055 ss-10]|uniref:NAD(P)-binding protein n=1 Tax=Cylindrobasidium torrendii FP15055 ss-10 TaxID=1314674 RepID=A0A0D7BAS9_9AGAR|nr:hypothetical protein CYLTODRAFT_444169 [Cylindrobasidium torrendii FP15055 ss-10]